MQDFLFKPGDFVTIEAELGVLIPPRKLRVLERLTQECIGGVQRHYVLRTFSICDDSPALLNEATLRLHDFEVVAYPSAEEIQAMLAEHERKKEEAMQRQAELWKKKKEA